MIQSNTSVIDHHATQLTSAKSNVLIAGVTVKDNETTLAGNHTALSAIDKESNIGSQAAEILESFTSCAQRVSQDFEAVDEQISQQFYATEPS